MYFQCSVLRFDLNICSTMYTSTKSFFRLNLLDLIYKTFIFSKLKNGSKIFGSTCNVEVGTHLVSCIMYI